MSYTIDEYDNSIVIDGWQNGIAESPYDGLSDMRNCNIVSVPGEASVNFSTEKISAAVIAGGSVTSANTGTDAVTFTGAVGLETNMAITFSAVTVTGLTTSTVYWIIKTGSTFKLYSDYSINTLVDLTSDGTGTFTVYSTPEIPKYFADDLRTGDSYMVDSNGRVWGDGTTTESNYWVFTGNTTLTNSSGNGLVTYATSNGTSSRNTYLFVFRNGLIDYIRNPTGIGSAWVYGWDPDDGSTANTGTVLKTQGGVSNNHDSIVAPDNKVYFCDGPYIDRFYQSSASTEFDPTNTATYTWDQTRVLPYTDISQCLAPLGNNILIGGEKNIIYPWNTVDTTPNYPILLAEQNIQKMITINTNTYILVGKRGRIYITNGSQAQLFKKIPDHISNTVEPYFIWGGVTSIKNQLYFSFSVTDNDGTVNNNYGGVWGIDLDTNALRLSHKLSYNTYLGIATALHPNYDLNNNGTGLVIGWNDGASGYGIDVTTSNLHTGSQVTIDSDLIPIGTFEKPRNATRIEYKLSKPMVSGESITIKYRLDFSQAYTSVLTDSTTGNFSSDGPINFSNAQWVQFQIILNGTNTTPSFTRLKEIRIKGLSS